MSETMSLSGGAILYSLSYERVDDAEPPTGRRVEFVGKNGTTGELKDAHKHFTLGQVLTIQDICIDVGVNLVKFQEVPGVYFNTEMFKDV